MVKTDDYHVVCHASNLYNLFIYSFKDTFKVGTMVEVATNYRKAMRISTFNS